MKRTAAVVFLLAATLLLTACGFHLRGSRGEANLPFQSIFIGFPKASVLTVELKRNIAVAGSTEIATDRKEAQVILEPLAETRRKAILSLNSQGRVREYLLLYLVRFQLRDQNGAFLLEPTDIELRRTLNYSETEALAKEAEEQLLYRDMQIDAAQQIVRRLAAVKVTPATNSTAAASPPVAK